MAFTLAAHYESQDAAGVFVNMAALADAHIFTSADDLRVPQLNRLVGIAAGVSSGGSGYARIESPSLRRRGRLPVQPINGNADADAEPGSPPAVLDLRDTPVVLVTDEILQAFVDSNPGSARAEWVLYWFADSPITPVTGDIFSVRVTDTATLAADAWTSSDPTFLDTLAVGRYQIVGARFTAAGLVAARFIFRGGPANVWRPGVIGNDSDGDLDHPMFRHGGMGVYGEFHSTTPPSIEYLSISADTAEEGVLDLIQVA